VAQALRADPAINAASFGATLHASGASQQALDAALAPYRDRGLQITPVATSLEDVFIALMQQSEDNWSSFHQ
ncbi:MAG TPA: ABC transporter ATP-binding protein, partial [Noviherbaspirillum sp.]|nr:ABC transporter ATP-binding protein [Noviherbaspirillum sp.]